MQSRIVDLVEKQTEQAEVLKGLKFRKLDQKYMYIGENGKDHWLALIESNAHWSNPEASDLGAYKAQVERVRKNIKGKRINIFALGCGEGSREHDAIQHFIELGYEVTYYPVDYSLELLAITSKTAQTLNCHISPVRADIFSDKFSQFVEDTFEKDVPTIFLMLGKTFGNFLDENGILDTLYNILRVNDLVMFDVAICDPENKVKYLDNVSYLKQISENEKWENFVTPMLVNLGIKQSYGHIEIKYGYRDRQKNIFQRKHAFVFDRNINIEFDNQKLSFVKGEIINLLNVMWYEEQFFERLLDGHNFEVLDRQVNIDRRFGCFLMRLK